MIVKTNLTPDQLRCVQRVRTMLEAMNTQIHQGRPIEDNGRILHMMEIMDIQFQEEFGIGR